MQYVYERGDLKRYFAQIPNIADDELGPYEMRLYVHYKRVAGDGGECYEGIDTTAQKCKMSVSTTRRTRKALASKGWIELESKGTKGKELVHVTLIDKWDENYRQYSTKRNSIPISQTPPPYQIDTRTPISQTPKEEPYKEKQKKKNGGGIDPAAPTTPPSAPDIAAAVLKDLETAQRQKGMEVQANETAILAAFNTMNEQIKQGNRYKPITGTLKLAKDLAGRNETVDTMRSAWATCNANADNPMGAFMKWIQEGYLPPQREGHESKVVDGVVMVWVEGQGWVSTGRKAT